ncbi:hypothetical protein [Nitrosospira briensis]|uniref:hypothetical protein n=1 Tax=Nitrosospira briensis TaxID=35799 RepID=UPI0008F2155B|nr:hypothetical protein [Nitrosospira briensis]SFO33709.1 hypothetical protein SAMN05216332_11136 [Nitrosospira briensis]
MPILNRLILSFLLFSTLLLSGCFEGAFNSYPHDETLLLEPLPPGTYLRTDSEGKTTTIKLTMKGEKLYKLFADNRTYEIGFYANSTTTYLMFARNLSLDHPSNRGTFDDGQKWYYFLVQPTANNGFVVYDATAAGLRLLNQIVGENIQSPLSEMPFRKADYNKVFFQRLGALDSSNFSVKYTISRAN